VLYTASYSNMLYYSSISIANTVCKYSKAFDKTEGFVSKNRSVIHFKNEIQVWQLWQCNDIVFCLCELCLCGEDAFTHSVLVKTDIQVWCDVMCHFFNVSF
jgi:hypothetical protein